MAQMWADALAIVSIHPIASRWREKISFVASTWIACGACSRSSRDSAAHDGVAQFNAALRCDAFSLGFARGAALRRSRATSSQDCATWHAMPDGVRECNMRDGGSSRNRTVINSTTAQLRKPTTALLRRGADTIVDRTTASVTSVTGLIAAKAARSPGADAAGVSPTSGADAAAAHRTTARCSSWRPALPRRTRRA